MSSAVKPFQFDRLPPEIQVMVWEQVFLAMKDEAKDKARCIVKRQNESQDYIVSCTGPEPYSMALLCRWAWDTFISCAFPETKYVHFKDSAGISHWVDVGTTLFFEGIRGEELEDAVASVPRGIVETTRLIEWSIENYLPTSGKFHALGCPKGVFFSLVWENDIDCGADNSGGDENLFDFDSEESSNKSECSSDTSSRYPD